MRHDRPGAERLRGLVDGAIGDWLSEHEFRLTEMADYGMGGDIIAYSGPIKVAFFDQQRDCDVGCYVAPRWAEAAPGSAASGWRSLEAFVPDAYDYAGYKKYDVASVATEFCNAYADIARTLSEMERTR